MRERGDVGYLVVTQFDVIQRDEPGQRREVDYRVVAQLQPFQIDSELQTSQRANFPTIGVKSVQLRHVLARDLRAFLFAEVPFNGSAEVRVGDVHNLCCCVRRHD